MQLETLVDAEVAHLARSLDGASPAAVIAAVLARHPGRVAAVSSFGAESVVLLHLLAQVDRGAPVLFLDTQIVFPETLAYQREVAAALGLTGLVTVTPEAGGDPAGDLHRRDPDACCALRKTRPLEAALAGFDGWITGRKRHQTRARAALPVVERDAAGRLKANPLAAWSAAEVAAYMDRHALPRHPLIREGYLSIGCAPCTSRVAPGEDPRAGRWRGRDKEECGIHLVNGRWVRREAMEGADG